ncbi:MAG: SPOR domain-containing protein [Treponema sp.]|nr:SPOR domain-containing protein [Treponema sp.]
MSMSTEIFRLEQPFTGSDSERFARQMELSTIYYLSGNVELALRAVESALAVFPNDTNALFMQTRYLIALGEYDRATWTVNRLMGMNLRGEEEKELLLLDANLKAFQHSDFRSLSALADDTGFLGQRSAIYYTLYVLQGDIFWRNRLNLEYRNSPEARIGSDQRVNPAPTPLWLLFPGRHSIGLRSMPQTQRPATPLAPPAATVAPGPQLQAGLFSREDNARSLAGRITAAGFQASVSRRTVNGNTFWAVLVPAGNDSNATIRRLREAGFESFPIP